MPYIHPNKAHFNPESTGRCGRYCSTTGQRYYYSLYLPQRPPTPSRPRQQSPSLFRRYRDVRRNARQIISAVRTKVLNSRGFVAQGVHYAPWMGATKQHAVRLGKKFTFSPKATHRLSGERASKQIKGINQLTNICGIQGCMYGGGKHGSYSDTGAIFRLK